MDYSVCSLESKQLLGLSVAITRSQSQNYHIISKLWRDFNLKLRESNLNKNTGRNWEKFGITYRNGDIYMYFCGIPVSCNTNSTFEERFIPQGHYVLFRHIGEMYKLKDTFNLIYKETVPNGNFTLNQSSFFHFERYDYLFNWNNRNSIIEIYLPVDN